MGCCCFGQEPAAVMASKNLMTSEEFKAATGNYAKIMGRTWYCIANNMGGKPHAMEAMWELNTWNSGSHDLGTNCFTNHTITRKVGSKEIEADPLWPGNILEGAAGMQPVLPMCCCNMTLSNKSWQNISFPTNDSFTEFWTYEMPMMGMRPLFIFALTPHVSEKLYNAHLKNLKTEHGYTPAMISKIARIRWPADYKPGDCFEESTNQEGVGATLASSYKAKVNVK